MEGERKRAGEREKKKRREREEKRKREKVEVEFVCFLPSFVCFMSPFPRHFTLSVAREF